MLPVLIKTLRRVWRVEGESASRAFEFLRAEPDNAPPVERQTTLRVEGMEDLGRIKLPDGRRIAGSTSWLALEIDSFIWRESLSDEVEHAALRAVVLASPDGERVALVGPAGCGKTWLGLELAIRGWSFDGDGVLFVGRDGARMHPRPFRLRDPIRGFPAAWRCFLGSAPYVEGDIGWRVTSFDPRRIGGSWSMKSAPVGRIIFPWFNPGGALALRRISVADAFRACLALNLTPRNGAGLAALYSMLCSAELHDLRFGHSAGGADVIEVACGRRTAS